MLKAAGVHSHLPIDQIFANIGNLKWDHVSLIKYLVKVKDELSLEDVKKLKSTEMFPDQKDLGIHKLSILYSDSIDSDLIRILGLKVLKWNSNIPKESSELGRFLVTLGFNYIIPWRILLKGVNYSLPSDRALIFKYFFENFSSYDDYNGSKVDFPFVPVESADGKDVCTFLPSQVFMDLPLNHLGFYLIHPELKKYSQLIGVKERPSNDLIVKQVLSTRLDLKASEEVFSYCARISNEFLKEDWMMFQKGPFIPTVENHKLVYKFYNQVFLPPQFQSESKVFADLFDQVDFGVQANSFLRSVGVVDEPRAENLISLLLEDPIKVFSQLKASKYTELMERISKQWPNISSKHSNLSKAFSTSKCFIGYIRSTETDLEGEEDKLQFSLYGIDELFLIDDIISHQLFNLPTAPTSLESFYYKLGCRWVSSVIRSEWKWTGKVQSEGVLINSARKILSERRNLIINSLDNSDGKILKGGRKRLEAVKLFQVDSIEICRTYTVSNLTNSQTTCAFSDGAAAHPSIYLAKNSEGQFDHFDLASIIVSILCDKKGRLQDSLLVASLLTTPLSSLRAKGFQVDTKREEEKIFLGPETLKVQKENEKESMSISDKPIQKTMKIPQLTQEISAEYIKKDLPDPDNPGDKRTVSSNDVDSAGPKRSSKWSESFMGFLRKAAGESFASTESLKPPPPATTEPGKAGDGRNEESLRKALDRGIKSLKPHTPGDFDATIQRTPVADEPAPENQTVRRELNSYCQVISSLRFIGKIGSVDIYAGDSLKPEMENEFFSNNKDSLRSFYGLIVDELSESVFKVSTRSKSKSSSIQLFYDPKSCAIAFNRDHSLFFNFAYFLSNGHDEILNSHPSKDPKEVQRCKCFWFITFCHELAHNFVHAHDAQHEYYLSSFAETFLPDFIALIIK
ncbi:hypothetical protein C9890_0163 [Perkinsus sp. BL_2016]|nr:hypothetical protein C9890_0163 [Perkinsus sp. BL_2016]